jgi:hypothetical protein
LTSGTNEPSLFFFFSPFFYLISAHPLTLWTMSGASNTKRTNPRRKGGLAAQSKKKKNTIQKERKGKEEWRSG